MNRRRPLPSSLRVPAFSVEDGLGAGATTRQLRYRALDASVWGVRATKPAEELAERCALFAVRLGDATFFCLRTAAALHDIPLPPSRSQLIDVAVPPPDRAPHARGLRGHTMAAGPADVTLLEGLRLTTVARTWFDLGKVLALPDLVAAGDRIISSRSALASSAELAAMIAAHPGERGVRRLDAALAMLSDRAESPQESRLRAALSVGGIPAPSVNLDIRDERGSFLARGDLVWERERLVVEYQGDYHREKAQWRADMTRRARLEVAGWRVLEVNADDLATPEALVERIRTLLYR